MTRHFPKPKKKVLDAQEIEQFLRSINFKSDFIKQEWRHFTAFGTFQDKPAVFKLASTIATGRYTQKEFLWNEGVNALPEASRRHISVPVNYTSGFYGKLFYFIDQRFPEPALAQKLTPLGNEEAHYLPRIAEATRDIQLFSFSEEFKQKASRPVKKGIKKLSAGERLVEAATEWASQVPRDLEPFLEILRSTQFQIRTAPAHADFVIRHMYDVNGKIGVIDAEHFGLHAPLHYDVAQFYIRLRSDHQAKELAHQYLQLFKKLLPPSEQATFWEELKPPLVQRYIGDLWGSAKNPAKLNELEEMGREILSDNIL